MNLRFVTCCAIAMGMASMLAPTPTSAQWTNRYSKLSDFGHHVYFEQHELPILANGPTDPAPAPDGRSLAFAAKGWIWRLDLESGVATRLTHGSGVDSRPRWSPTGDRLALVRDDGKDTSIVILSTATGTEQVINTPTIELDPEFSADGDYLYYSSGRGGVLSLWRRHLASGADERLTDLPQVERNARRMPGGLVYLHGNRESRVLRMREFVSGTDKIIHAETQTYHLGADTHPSQRLIVYSAPIDNDYHLWTLDIDHPDVRHRLTDGKSFALTPAFSADGEHVYFVDLDEARQFRIKRMRTYGGAATPVEIKRWDYRVPTGTLSLSLTDAAGKPVTARVAITASAGSGSGHPVAFDRDATYFDSQTGRHYFYVPGEAALTLPVGEYQVTVARGPMAPITSKKVQVRAGADAAVTATVAPLWDATSAGYVSVDHHIHLNGDGHHRATHADALRLLAGEDLDQVSPMSWDRWERRIDAPLIGVETADAGRVVAQGQEVRSHFHGHVSLLGTERPFAPWFFGPGNPTLGNPDLSNGDVIAFAQANNALATYVHPIATDVDPFTRLKDAPIPLELLSDAVLADRVGLEMVCAWTSPLGNSHLWYRLLNVGRPVAAMSGTDMWVDFHRTPAMGTGRTYVRLDPANATADAVREAAAAGRSFVTTGPALLFQLGNGAQPGGVTPAGPQSWSVDLTSTVAVDVLEIVVNGTVVQRLDGVAAGKRRTYKGEVSLPQGGWVAARAYASKTVADAWPTMHARPFAHASPIWIGQVGSTEPGARSAAAADLIRGIDFAAQRARASYDKVETPRMQARFDQARAKLRGMIEPAAVTAAPGRPAAKTEKAVGSP
ncbi:MAG: Secreted protein [uncultured Lysobacter sp.]|uniref:Secreted protein n=1 Tax=uncultured Lysobacter sp. TaxID=271060 RepID=A0A6J4M6U6_9GAMM|nr:MAG: Secreted protein [uncultured Lysobacter sp.]